MKRLFLASGILLFCACARTEQLGGSDCNLAAGDLVLTEVMANPAGSDSGHEWFEAKSTKASALSLAGLELVTSKPDGTGEVKHVVTQLTVAPGAYVVFGGAAPSPKPAFVDYDYGTTLGALSNDGARLLLRCKGVIVDQVTYSKPKEGASLLLDGRLGADAAANDVAANWCDATVEYEPGNKGSPGQANPLCPAPAAATTCDDGGTTRPVVRPGPGDLVISEIMANPNKVADEQGEWLEITVLKDVDLNGLQIGTTPGTPLVTVTDAACRHHAAGSQVVFARSADPATNGGLPAVEGTFDFGLPNSGGTLWVGVDGEVLDQTSWTRSYDGASISLDPGSLDPLANDDETHFCAGQSSYGDGDLGTPGAPNDACAGVVSSGTCLDGGTLRDVRAPGPGDLVITEYLANPTGVDTGKEWFEVLVKRDVDLNGLELGATYPTVINTISSPTCLPAAAGSLLVFAHNDGTSDDGGLPRIDYRFKFDLVNSNRGIFLGHGGALVDAVSYTTVTEGGSRSLDPGRLDATANDADGSWCDGATAYGDGTNFGTPGSPNPQCPIIGGACRDGATTRPIVAPAAGDLVISEIMADPAAVGDEEGEWFEVTVVHDVDVNGLEIGTKPGTPALTIADGNCRRRHAGDRLVFARSADPAVNGGLPPVEEPFRFALANSGGTLFLGTGGAVLDQVTWSSSASGVSRSLSPQSTDPTANDVDANWCPASSTYGAGDKGTPGKVNDACGAVVPAGQCLDHGTLRDVVPPDPGDLVITEIFPDATGSDTGKEWFEVHANRSVDLNGLELGTAFPKVLDTVTGSDCVHAAAGAYLVFAHNDGTVPNGGLPRVDVRFGFSLVNSASGVFIGRGGVLLDAASYTTVRAGVARSLAPDKLDTTANDDEASWCDATSVYGFGDKGTPGAANPTCPPVVPAGKCLDGDVVRDLVSPKVGDLVISEIMQNPKAVSDTSGEWFEVTVRNDVDLNGIELGTGGTSFFHIDDPLCRRRARGSRLVFARDGDPTINGGLPPVEATFSFSLSNSDGLLEIVLDGKILDRTVWTSSSDGAARNLDPTKIGTVENDFESSWCPASAGYGAGDLGTPGAPNSPCPVVVPAGSCLEADGKTLRKLVAPQAGDLVISEVMADPTVVSDTDGEWFEITVLSPVDVNDLELGTTPGTPQTTLEDPRCRHRDAGSRLVFARNADPTANGGLPPVETTFSFSLSNGSGSLYVGAGGSVVDAVTWTSTVPGHASNLDPDSIDATANDDPTTWCPATLSYGSGDDGSPGQPNEPCPVVVPAGSCLEDDGITVRKLVTPLPGDAVISEVMPDPNAVGDSAGEWFEVTLLADVDVNGLEAGTLAGTPQMTIADSHCRPRTAGSALVFAHGGDPMVNGGLPAPEATFGFGLTNGAGSLYIGAFGVVLDQIAWSTSEPGVARSLDPDRLDPTANDDDAAWCPAMTGYGAGDLGTPGVENPQCPVAVPPGKCLLDDGMTVRDLVVPQVGDLVITEVMADPTVVTDTAGEWFEVTVVHDVDLNGLQIGTSFGTPQRTLTGTACRPRAAGSILVFAHGTDPAVNGMLPAPEDVFGFGLGNTAGSLYIGVNDALLDQVTWTATTAGASRSLDPDSLDPTANDSDASWCPATMSYDGADKGSPGQPNEQCPVVLPPGTCLGADGMARDPLPPAAGGLVISEVMANPSGDDTQREWFEVTLLADADLFGLQLGTTAGTVQATLGGSDCRHHSAGTAVVFAHSADSGVNGGLPAPEGLFTFPLGNTTGSLFVGIANTVLDQVSWTASVDGAARSLDPSHLDPTANDADASWCTATATYGAGGKGSPGMANETCVPAGMCLDGGVLRAIVAPAPGDLVISEVQAGQSDSNKDWLEVTVLHDVDVNGLQLGPTAGSASTTVTDSLCRRRTAGTALIFAASADPAVNGGLPAPEATLGFALNASGAAWIGVGGAPLDGVTWTSVAEGVSRNLDPDSLDPAANDLAASWCPSTVAWSGGLGSPGAANEQCPVGPPQCLDTDGSMRDIVAPAVGDLLITEVMNNPSGTETHKEWFEVLVNRDVDLAGLSVCSPASTCASSTAFSATDCQRVAAGSYLIFANGTVAQSGLPRVDYAFTFSLVNTASTVAVLVGGQILDSAAWISSTVDGTSRTLKHTKFDTVGNDTSTNFCNSTALYDGTDKGTPGMDDPSCQ